MTRIDYKKHYNATKKYLELTFNDNLLSSKIKTDKGFNELILKLISLLNFLENKSKITEKDKVSTKYSNNMETIENKKISFKTIKITDEAEIIDTLNYFKIFIKNLFNIEIKNDRIVHLKSEEKIINLYESQNSIAAFERIQFEIKQGNIYIFTTKPKIIPILKKIIIITMSILAVGGLIASFAQFLIGSLTYADGNSDNIILNAILYLFIPVFTFFLIKNIYSSLKPTKRINGEKKINLNFYYYCAWQVILLSLIGIFFICIWDIFGFDGTIFVFLLDNHSEQWKYILWFIGEIAISFGFISSLIICIILSFFNPKEDKNKINSIKNNSDIDNQNLPPKHDI